MKINKCPVCEKRYIRLGWLIRHVERFGGGQHKVFLTGIHRQTTVMEF